MGMKVRPFKPEGEVVMSYNCDSVVEVRAQPKEKNQHGEIVTRFIICEKTDESKRQAELKVSLEVRKKA